MAGDEEAPREEVSYAEPAWDWDSEPHDSQPHDSEPHPDLYGDPYADTYVRWPEPEAPIRRPLHRNPVVLLGLIAAASVPLSVAAVLLLTGDEADDRPITLKPTIRTTAVVVPPSESPSQTPVVETTPETSAESTAEEATATESDEEIPAAPVEAPAPLPSARGGGSDNSEGPRINVTRNPMSFTPGG